MCSLHVKLAIVEWEGLIICNMQLFVSHQLATSEIFNQKCFCDFFFVDQKKNFLIDFNP